MTRLRAADNTPSCSVCVCVLLLLLCVRVCLSVSLCVRSCANTAVDRQATDDTFIIPVLLGERVSGNGNYNVLKEFGAFGSMDEDEFDVTSATCTHRTERETARRLFAIQVCACVCVCVCVCLCSRAPDSCALD